MSLLRLPAPYLRTRPKKDRLSLHHVLLLFPLHPAAFSQETQIYGCCCTCGSLLCVAIAQGPHGQLDLLVITAQAGSSSPVHRHTREHGVLSPGAAARFLLGVHRRELQAHCLGSAPPSAGKAAVSSECAVALPAVPIVHAFSSQCRFFCLSHSSGWVTLAVQVALVCLKHGGHYFVYSHLDFFVKCLLCPGILSP